MWLGHHFQGQKVKGQLAADVLNSQHAGTGATWRINTKILLCRNSTATWRIIAKILSTCRGGGAEAYCVPTRTACLYCKKFKWMSQFKTNLLYPIFCNSNRQNKQTNKCQRKHNLLGRGNHQNIFYCATFATSSISCHLCLLITGGAKWKSEPLQCEYDHWHVLLILNVKMCFMFTPLSSSSCDAELLSRLRAAQRLPRILNRTKTSTILTRLRCWCRRLVA